jgi:hypothetical protein
MVLDKQPEVRMAATRITADVPTTTVAKRKKKDQNERVKQFLQSLPSEEIAYAPADVARELHKSFKMRQESMLLHLREGTLVASIRWPEDQVLRIPRALWDDLEDSEFNVRRRLKGRWRRGRCPIPLHLLQRHLSQPLLEMASNFESGTDSKSLAVVAHILNTSVEKLEQEGSQDPAALVARLADLATQMRASKLDTRTPMISPSDLRAFAYRTLAPAYRESKKGRPARGRIEELILEAVRRIEAFRATSRLPAFKLPNQARFAEELLLWWNDPSNVPPRPELRIDHIHKWVKAVYAAYKIEALE